jgi:hypothetical protein
VRDVHRYRVGELPGEVTVRPNWPVVGLAFVGLAAALAWLGALLDGSPS